MITAGRLRFLPGRPLPTIASTRPLHLSRVLQGQAARAAEQVLPAVYSLCGSAHRLAATLATDAALGLRSRATSTEMASLERDTLREHLRRLWLDWPRWLQRSPSPDASIGQLGALLAELQAPDATPATAIAQAVFGGTPASMQAWLRACRAGDEAELQAWVRQAPSAPARTLAAVWDAGRRLAVDALPPLPGIWPPPALAALWLALWQAPTDAAEFLAAPRWQGHPAETGPWTRALSRPPRHALDRLLGRLAETAQLALPDGAVSPTLASGTWSPEPGQALAWCQMARGLLVHAVILDGSGDAARIEDYRVLAPTEWNFHPRGAAARALSALDDRANPDAACGLIAAAFDPCVEFDIHTAAEGPVHA